MRQSNTWAAVPFLVLAAGCGTLTQSDQRLETPEPLTAFEGAEGIGDELSIEPPCWETTGEQMLPHVERAILASRGNLDFSFRVGEPGDLDLIKVPAAAQLTEGGTEVSGWVGEFLAGPVREARNTTIYFQTPGSGIHFVDFLAWPVVLRPSILEEVHLLRYDTITNEARGTTTTRFLAWVLMDPLEEHLTFDPRPYRNVEFTPSVGASGQQQARVRYRRFEPGTYGGTWYWDEDDEVEIYQVNVEVPKETPPDTTVLEVQATCGGDHVHGRTRF